jgi:hypothetical protein
LPFSTGGEENSRLVVPVSAAFNRNRQAERAKIAQTSGLRVAAKLPKPFRPKQFAYLLMSLI